MKRKISVVLASLLAGAMSLGLSACNGGSNSSSAATSAPLTDKTTSGVESTTAVKSNGESEEYGPLMSRIKSDGVLIVGTASGYSPYEFVDITSADQEVIGVDMAFGKKIAEKLGVEMRIEDMTFSGLLGAITTDKIDIAIAGMSPTEERKKSMDFSDVYVTGEQRVITTKEKAALFTGLDSFDGYNVAVQKSTTQETLATEFLTGANVVSLEKIPNCILELTSGKADAIVIESTVAQQYIIANEDLTFADVEFPEERRYKDTVIGIAKGNEDLIAVINEVIAELKDQDQFTKWIDEYSAIAVANAS